jgi:peptide/nickel transport system substrate-binding protein
MPDDRTVERLGSLALSRRNLIKYGLAAGGAAALAACVPGASPTPSGGSKGPSVLKVGIGESADWLSPNMINRSPSFSVYYAMFETLAWNDRTTGEVKPMLAKSWKVQNDKLTWDLELQDGVKFHNGEDFDAESVKTTFDYLLNDKPDDTPYARVKTATLDRVEIVDRYHVRLITQKPYVIFPRILNEVYLYPAKHFKAVGPEGFAKNPVGTGKYRLKAWDKGVKTTLERFDGHWGWGGKANIDQIEFRGYPEDATRVAALKAREADIVQGLPPDDADGVKAAGMNVQWTPLAQAMVLLLLPVKGSPLEDKRVRQAISYGINVDSILKNVMLGYGDKLNGQVLPKSVFGYNPGLQPYPYDVAKAKDLLKQAGFADGFTIDFDISQGRYTKQKEVNEAIAGQLANIGIKTNLKLLEWGAFVDKLFVKHANTPLNYIGWNYFSAFDADFVLPQYKSTNPFFPNTPKTFDDLLAKSEAEFDSKTRQGLLQQITTLMKDEAPSVYLFEAPDVFGVNPRVKNFKPTPDNGIHFEDVSVG